MEVSIGRNTDPSTKELVDGTLAPSNIKYGNVSEILISMNWCNANGTVKLFTFYFI